MESNAERPLKLAPYPTEVGTAMTGHHRGQSPFHAGHGDHAPGRHERLQVGEQPVQTGHAHVVQARHLAAQSLRRQCGLLTDRKV